MARPKVEKNIYLDDGNHLYYVNMDFGKGESGKRIKKTPTFKTLTKARKALKEFEADKTKGTLLTPNKTTLADWLSYWVNDIIIPNREKSTVYGYQQMIDNHISPELGNIPLQELKANQVQQYYTKMSTQKHLSASTILKHHQLLKTALKLAVMQGVINLNPIERVISPKVKGKEANFYNQEQLKKLLSLVEGDRLEVVIKLGGCAGLRREEICGLKWENIDFEKRVMYIRNARTMAGSEVIEKDTKNDSSTRVLFITDELLEVLNKEKAKQDENKAIFKESYIDSGFVMVWETGKPYRPNYLSELVTKFITDNDLPKIVLHGLRHTYASLANSSNATLFDISKALGHSTPSITGKIYTHMLDKTNEDTMKKVADSLK